jgi:Right handed beta helix region
VSGFDFRALIKNQWIIVCSLVGLVALCTTVVDVSTGKFGSSSNTPTANNNQTTNTNQTGNQATPQPQAVSKPKHGRQWVLDSTGASDADAKDFAPIVNSLQDGDTIQVKAGSYNGPLALAKSVIITGDTDQKTAARASIHYSGGTGCVITGSQVTLQNLDVSETSEGGSVLISAISQSVLQIKNCNLLSRGSNCIGMSENAQLTLQDSSLRTVSKGKACTIEGYAKATIDRCTFEENLRCIDCLGQGSVAANDCKFQNNISDSKDASLIYFGSTGSAQLSRCTFTENTGVVTDAQGMMTLTNCRFEKNREGYWKYTVASTSWQSASGKLALSACEFVSNPRALMVSNGGQLTMEGCKFQNCGQLPKGGDAAANYANLLVMGEGSLATVTNTNFTDVQFAGVLVADQAHATLKDISIHGGQYGIDLGVTASNLAKGGSAELENATLSGQTGQAARLTRGSYLKLFNCHLDGEAWDSSIYVDTGSILEMAGSDLKGGKGNGLEVVGSNSQARAQQCQFLSFQGIGVVGRNEAKVGLTGCTLEQNDTGAQAIESAMLTLENCTIGSNRTYGVSALNAGYVSLANTTFTDQTNQSNKDGFSTVRISDKRAMTANQ